jgi:hypothetical protein
MLDTKDLNLILKSNIKNKTSGCFLISFSQWCVTNEKDLDSQAMTCLPELISVKI